jgi:hypothetical protein
MTTRDNPNNASSAETLDQLGHVLCDLPKSGGKIVRVKVTQYRNSQPYLDIREWYSTPDGELRPGKGANISSQQIADLYAALGQYLHGDTGAPHSI